jgi:hypothetical protein
VNVLPDEWHDLTATCARGVASARKMASGVAHGSWPNTSRTKALGCFW